MIDGLVGVLKGLWEQLQGIIEVTINTICTGDDIDSIGLVTTRKRNGKQVRIR
jgi:hypothetical protein